ncbi:hypothetical protein [Haladaptatus sp. NG-SE-30]
MATANLCPRSELLEAVESVRLEVEQTKKRELAEATAKLRQNDFSPEQRQVVASMADTITTRITADAVATLWTAVERKDREMVEAGCQVLGIDASNEGQH